MGTVRFLDNATLMAQFGNDAEILTDPFSLSGMNTADVRVHVEVMDGTGGTPQVDVFAQASNNGGPTNQDFSNLNHLVPVRTSPRAHIVILVCLCALASCDGAAQNEASALADGDVFDAVWARSSRETISLERPAIGPLTTSTQQETTVGCRIYVEEDTETTSWLIRVEYRRFQVRISGDTDEPIAWSEICNLNLDDPGDSDLEGAPSSYRLLLGETFSCRLDDRCNLIEHDDLSKFISRVVAVGDTDSLSAARRERLEVVLEGSFWCPLTTRIMAELPEGMRDQGNAWRQENVTAEPLWESLRSGPRAFLVRAVRGKVLELGFTSTLGSGKPEDLTGTREGSLFVDEDCPILQHGSFTDVIGRRTEFGEMTGEVEAKVVTKFEIRRHNEK